MITVWCTTGVNTLYIVFFLKGLVVCTFLWSMLCLSAKFWFYNSAQTRRCLLKKSVAIFGCNTRQLISCINALRHVLPLLEKVDGWIWDWGFRGGGVGWEVALYSEKEASFFLQRPEYKTKWEGVQGKELVVDVWCEWGVSGRGSWVSVCRSGRCV